MPRPVTAGALALLLLAAAPAALAQPGAPSPTVAPAPAANPFAATTLSLDAEGKVEVQPDMAEITLGVTTEAPTAAAAMQANAQRMAAVIAALKARGLAPRDIRTSGLNLNPQYRYVENQPPQLTGYQAANQVTVTVRDLARLGPAVDASVSAGANQVNGISFDLADRTAAEDAARLAAVKALSAKAELYARATGHRILRLVSLSEGAAAPPMQPMPMIAMTAQRFAKADTPVSPGAMTVRVQVSGLYELTP